MVDTMLRKTNQPCPTVRPTVLTYGKTNQLIPTSGVGGALYCGQVLHQRATSFHYSGRLRAACDCIPS
eukprot:7829570-Prorocentrum_lima.AAC.1